MDKKSAVLAKIGSLSEARQRFSRKAFHMLLVLQVFAIILSVILFYNQPKQFMFYMLPVTLFLVVSLIACRMFGPAKAGMLYTLVYSLTNIGQALAREGFLGLSRFSMFHIAIIATALSGHVFGAVLAISNIVIYLLFYARERLGYFAPYEVFDVELQRYLLTIRGFVVYVFICILYAFSVSCRISRSDRLC